MKRQVIWIIVLLFFFALGQPLPQATRRVPSNEIPRRAPADVAAPIRKGQLHQILASMPLGFEPNLGLADEEVRFLSHGNGYTLYFTPKRVLLTSRTAAAAPARMDAPTPALTMKKRNVAVATAQCP